jgi:putative phage-type endonuclease
VKLLELEQGSSSWKEFRHGKVGASDIGVLMTGTDVEIFDLWLDKTSGIDRKPTQAMQRGIDLELDAISYFQMKTGKEWRKITALHEDCEALMASFDGYNEELNECVEVKCPLDVPERIEDLSYFRRYWWQVQAQLAVSEGERAHLLVYSPQVQRELIIEPSFECIQQLLEKAAWFHQFLHGKEMPPPFRKKEDEEWKGCAEAWKIAKIQLEEAQEAEALCREALIWLAAGEPSEGEGVRVSKYVRTGNIDYSKVPELKDIDLSTYRKPSTICWRLSSR